MGGRMELEGGRSVMDAHYFLVILGSSWAMPSATVEV